MNKLAKVLVLGTVVLSLSLSAHAIEKKIGIGTVTTNGLRLRASASTDAGILANATANDKVVIIRKVDNWYLVDYNLDIGYMSADYLEFDPVKNIELGYGKAEESSANVRATPSSDGDLVAQMPLGETAYIIGFNNGWYKVQYEGMIGYVRSDLLALTQCPVGNSSGKGIASSVIAYAKEFMGTPYVFGGTTPGGFDCSGFTRYVLRNFGIEVQRTAADQLSAGYAVDRSQLSPGDLVFFNRTYNSGAAATHVGIYIGGGEFIHAASGGVKITALSDDYYASRYVGARRVL